MASQDPDANVQATYEARDRLFTKPLTDSHAYTMNKDVVAKMINPAFQGGPRWPNLRQAHRVFRSSSRVMIVSDGLSDPGHPSVMEPFEGLSGFGYELLAEFVNSDDPNYPSKFDSQNNGDWVRNWEIQMVDQMTQMLAGQMGPTLLATLEAQGGVISTEASRFGAPQRFVNPDNGEVGILFFGSKAPWLPRADLAYPTGKCKIIVMKLLTAEQLKSITSSPNPKLTRLQLAAEFNADRSYYHVNELGSPRVQASGGGAPPNPPPSCCTIS